MRWVLHFLMFGPDDVWSDVSTLHVCLLNTLILTAPCWLLSP